MYLVISLVIGLLFVVLEKYLIGGRKKISLALNSWWYNLNVSGDQ